MPADSSGLRSSTIGLDPMATRSATSTARNNVVWPAASTRRRRARESPAPAFSPRRAVDPPRDTAASPATIAPTMARPTAAGQ